MADLALEALEDGLAVDTEAAILPALARALGDRAVYLLTRETRIAVECMDRQSG